MSTETEGSGFISQDNDDDTAENCFLLREEAAIPREMMLHWNAVPWFLERQNVMADDRAGGARVLSNVIRRMPVLSVVILAGNVVKDTWDTNYIRLPGARTLPVERTWHPSHRGMGLRKNPYPTPRNEQRQTDFLAALRHATRFCR